MIPKRGFDCENNALYSRLFHCWPLCERKVNTLQVYTVCVCATHIIYSLKFKQLNSNWLIFSLFLFNSIFANFRIYDDKFLFAAVAAAAAGGSLNVLQRFIFAHTPVCSSTLFLMFFFFFFGQRSITGGALYTRSDLRNLIAKLRRSHKLEYSISLLCLRCTFDTACSNLFGKLHC